MQTPRSKPIPTPEQQKELSLTAVTKKTILVIDDIILVRRLFREKLESEVLKVLDAPDGKSALKIINDASLSIDFFIVDIILPDINGLDLIKVIRKIPKYSQAPMIVCTAQASHRLFRKRKN